MDSSCVPSGKRRPAIDSITVHADAMRHDPTGAVDYLVTAYLIPCHGVPTTGKASTLYIIGLGHFATYVDETTNYSRHYEQSQYAQTGACLHNLLCI